MTRRTARRGATLIGVALLALVGCTSDEDPSSGDGATPSPTATAPSTSASPTTAPPPAAPVPRACYQLTYDEALAPTSDSESLPCSEKHTSQTFAVGALDLVVNGHLLAVDSETVRRQLANRCPRKLAPFLGTNPRQLRLTLLRAVWFTPTIAESDAGAAWYRCDVVAVTDGASDPRLATLKGSLAKALRRPAVREAYGMCGTAEPGTETFSRVLCRQRHSWRAISVVDLSGASRKGAYPGKAAVRRAGQDGTCANAARAVARDALNYQWGYEWPTRKQWKAGQTYGLCWAPDPA